MPPPGTATIRLVPLEDLQPHPKNRRTWDVAEIAAMIVETGWHGVLVQQASTGYLVAGHGRTEAVRLLNGLAADHDEHDPSHPMTLCPLCHGLEGWPVAGLPVDVQDLTDEEALRKVVGDNRANELAAWDGEGLAEILAELDATERGLVGVGWSPDDLEQLVASLTTDPPPPR